MPEAISGRRLAGLSQLIKQFSRQIRDPADNRIPRRFIAREEYLLLYDLPMKKNQVLTALMTLGVAMLLFASPLSTHGQAEAEDAQIGLMLQAVGDQQLAIAKNQALIDEKIAVIAEDLRIARIYVSRAGGKTK